VMDQKLYRSLLLMVNTKATFTLMQEYASVRIAQYHAFLENEKNHDRVLEIQGAIKELRRIKTLRDEVIKGAE
jgi:hypothetical protein